MKKKRSRPQTIHPRDGQRGWIVWGRERGFCFVGDGRERGFLYVLSETGQRKPGLNKDWESGYGDDLLGKVV